MSKLAKVTSEVGGGLMFYCPGCRLHHYFRIERGPKWNGEPVWSWNGDMDKPTFSPSLGINMGKDCQCHLFVRDGKIEYLGDCYHELAGQTIELPDEV